MSSLKIIYIAGETRSGTTLIDRVLGTLDGVVSLCELSYVWESGFRDNNVCSCGRCFNECDFWTGVQDRVAIRPPDVDSVIAVHKQVLRSRNFPLLYSGVYNRTFARTLEIYREQLKHLLDAVAEESGCRILVDSSKYPSGPLVLAGIPGVDVYVLHVVRDPRGFVYSMQKGNYNPAYGGKMAVRSPLSSTTGWLVRNSFVELLSRRFPYHRLVYDRCLEDPQQCFDSVCTAFEPLRAQRPRFEDSTIDLPALHTISGNPHRFRDGPTTVRPDTEWRQKLPSGPRRIATVLGYPLMRRYGFK